jgi:hypothetical protein
MNVDLKKTQFALAFASAMGAIAISVVPTTANATKTQGHYMSGDFHNHTTCSDGSISLPKLVKKATDLTETPFGLDWFVQAGHGGNGNRNCTLAEDASIATPAYPLEYATDGVTVLGPNTTWQSSNPTVQPKGLASGSSPNQNMWRWQIMQEFMYPQLEYLSVYKNKPLYLGIETVTPGHEHTSAAVINGQMPNALDSVVLTGAPGYSPLGNANVLSEFEYCFDRSDTDTSRGDTTVGSGVGNNWDCTNPASAGSIDPTLGWNDAAKKLIQPGGTGTGTKGHGKSVESVKWMAQYAANTSYYIPAHLERAGPFNPDGNNGFNVESLRDFNNAGPAIAYGFETQPGHGASASRGEYTIRRNAFGTTNVDSVGGTTYGGTGIYGSQVGGVWDALLGEGRNWWFFASSDWHNRGSFGADDRRSTQDFYPGEYQRTYVMVRNGSDPKLRPQYIVDGLRTGNAFSSEGQLIDRMAFIACIAPAGSEAVGNLTIQNRAISLARNNTDGDFTGCAFMGEKLVTDPGKDIVVSMVVRDPSGINNSPYTFSNPSLAQVNISQPLNAPVLDHVDVIDGLVTGYKLPTASDYSGEWPRNWITPYLNGSAPDLSTVPPAAKNTSAAVIKTFNASTWTPVSADTQFKAMTFRIKAISASQYVRARGSNLPAGVPYETDVNGNPLPDIWTNPALVNPTTSGGTDGYAANYFLKIPCTVTGTNVPANSDTYTGASIDGCPNHLPVVNNVKYVAYDVAAWSDLWFYSNPIYIQVNGSTPVAGVQ